MSILAFLPRFREARRQLSMFAEQENWTRQEIESYQLDRINALWYEARVHVPYYHDLCGQRRLPDNFKSLDEYRASVPLLSKSTIKRDRMALLSARAQPGTWHRTSGSTGTPMNVFRSSADHREMLRRRYRFYSMWGLELFDRSAWVWSVPGGTSLTWAARAARGKQQCEDWFRNRLRIPASQLGASDLARHLRALQQFRPRGIYGFSRAVYLLARSAEEMAFDCDSLKVILLTGEAAPSFLTNAVSRGFGAPAAIEYGSVECGFLAGQWPDRSMRVREDGALLETLPRPDGLYDIVVTVLTNSCFPLLRYKIGDVTDRPLTSPERGFAVLGAIAGRNDDLVQTRTGRYIHPACIDELFERHETARVRRYLVHQDSTGAVTTHVELAKHDARRDTAALARQLGDLLEGYPVKIEFVDAVPQTAAGKHRLITSELAPEQNQEVAE